MPESESQLPELVLPPIEEANDPPNVDNPVNKPVQNPNGKGNQCVDHLDIEIRQIVIHPISLVTFGQN